MIDSLTVDVPCVGKTKFFERKETPFGDLNEKKESDFSDKCYVLFIDLINGGKIKDGIKIDYQFARQLYANPKLFYEQYNNKKNIEEQESKVDIQVIQTKKSIVQENSSQNKILDKNSQQKASFYGPISSYASDLESDVQILEDQNEDIGNSLNQHGYIPVSETEKLYVDHQEIDRIRYILLTKKNQQGRIALHIAAELGDKDFCTFIIKEAQILEQKCGEKIVDLIIDSQDQHLFTPLYLLCQKGYRKDNLQSSNDSDIQIENQEMNQRFIKQILELAKDTCKNHQYEENSTSEDEQQTNLKIKKKCDHNHQSHHHTALKLIQNNEQDIVNFEEINKDQNKDADQLEWEQKFKEGLIYSTIKEMPENQDDRNSNDVECASPSRNYLCQLLIQAGADPNIISEQVLHTPLHWLAYHGDYRAIQVYLKENKQFHLKPGGCLWNDPKHLINMHGALNAFQTHDGITPAGIAGDLKKKKSLKYLLQYFYENQNELQEIFISQSVRDNFELNRFTKKLYSEDEIQEKPFNFKENIKLAFL